MGLDWLLSRRTSPSTAKSGAFQRIFSFVLPPQERGRFFAELTPSPVGPRQLGQSSARAGKVSKAPIQNASGNAIDCFATDMTQLQDGDRRPRDDRPLTFFHASNKDFLANEFIEFSI